MLSRFCEPYLKPVISKATDYAKQYKLTPIIVVYASLGLSVLTFLFITLHLSTLALLALAFQRLSVGVADAMIEGEGAEKRPFGHYMRFFSNYFFFGGFLFFFMMAQEGAAVPGGFLFFAFYLNEASNFAYNQTLMTKEKMQRNAAAVPFKALFGLVDHAVITLFLILMCLVPIMFPLFAVILGFLCFASAIGRFMEVRLKSGSLADPYEPDGVVGDADDDTDIKGA